MQVVGQVPAPVGRQRSHRITRRNPARGLRQERGLHPQGPGPVLVHGGPQVQPLGQLGLHRLQLPETLRAEPFAVAQQAALDRPFVAGQVHRIERE